MQDLPSKTFTLGDSFRDGAESALKIYPSMGSNMYGFRNENPKCRRDLA